MSITPDGKMLYVPSFEKDTWNVVDGDDRRRGHDDRAQERRAQHGRAVSTASGMYLAGLKSPLLVGRRHEDHKVVETVGPFAAAIRPFTVNGAQTLCFVNVNELLGFEIGDLKTGKKLHRVEVAGFKTGPGEAARLPQPRHRPDARREGSLGRRRGQQRLHVFDATVMPPKQIESIKLARRAGLGDVQPRRQVRLPLDRRGDRHQDSQDHRRAQRREGRGGAQRETHGNRFCRQQAADGDQFGIGRIAGQSKTASSR